jgi:integrase
MVNAFYAELANNLAPKTVKNTHATMHRALADAVRQGVVARNVSDYAELPRAERHEMTVWTADELRAFLRHAESHRLHPAFRLACSAGLRRSEVLGMRWRSVDLDKGTAIVRDTVVPLAGKAVLRTGETKNRRSRRAVALDPKTVAVLRAHRLKQKKERLAAGPLWQDLDLCFTSEDGRPVKPDTFTRTWKRLAKAAGVPPLTPHAAARHTWASLALSAGVPLVTVSKRLGHSSLSTTADIYGHLSEQHDREAAELVAEMFK